MAGLILAEIKFIHLKYQCVGFMDLYAELNYNIHNYVFVCIESPKTNNPVFLLA